MLWRAMCAERAPTIQNVCGGLGHRRSCSCEAHFDLSRTNADISAPAIMYGHAHRSRGPLCQVRLSLAS